MNAAVITSAAPAVHQDLIRALPERARIHRLRDQQRRGDQLQYLQGQRRGVRFGARRHPSASHDEPSASADLFVVPWLPHALPRSFGPVALASPAGLAGRGGPADRGGQHGPVALRTPALPA